MPSSRFLIASNTLSSTAASVTFSSIPATYTDLVLRYSARTADPSADYYVQLKFNGSTGAEYSNTRVTGNGSAASSARNSNTTWGYAGVITGAGATSNTFGSDEIYIPNYAGSTFKPWSVAATMENNTTTSFMHAVAALRSITDAITSVSIIDASSVGFISGSSFFLYGLKNS